MGLKEMGWQKVDWTHLAQKQIQTWAVVKTVLNLLIPYHSLNLVFASKEEFFFMEFINSVVRYFMVFGSIAGSI
jgi:hypothetical protein